MGWVYKWKRLSLKATNQPEQPVRQTVAIETSFSGSGTRSRGFTQAEVTANMPEEEPMSLQMHTLAQAQIPKPSKRYSLAIVSARR